MSIQIDTAFVDQFKGNVIHLAQQKGSRLRPYVVEESITGKRASVERVGTTSMRKRLSRHSDTPRMDTPHSRRWVMGADFDWADLVDNEDKARLLISPESEYAKAAANAAGRQIDDIIIEAFDANAVSGADGTGSTAFAAGNIVAVDYVESGAAANSNLTIGKLREAKRLFDAADVDEDELRVMAITSSQLNALLRTTEVTNSDYAAVKALVQGQLDTFLGFKFVRTERLLQDASNYREVYAWCPSGMRLGINRDVKARMSERDDKNYALQVFLSMTMGAVRVEEEKVVQILCDES